MEAKPTVIVLGKADVRARWHCADRAPQLAFRGWARDSRGEKQAGLI